MTYRLLLASFLLLLGTNALAAMDRVHSASGEASSPCPTTAMAEPAESNIVKSDVANPAADHAAVPASTRSAAAPTSVRPTMRWHSFLPGMMK